MSAVVSSFPPEPIGGKIVLYNMFTDDRFVLELHLPKDNNLNNYIYVTMKIFIISECLKFPNP